MVTTGIIHLQAEDESGAEIVQLAFAVPILIVLIFGIIQLCVMSFFTLTLVGEADQSAWQADVAFLASCDEESANAHIKDLVLDNSVLLDAEALQIDNASFSITDPYSYKRTSRVAENRTLYSEGKKERFDIRQLYREVVGGLVEFDISYTIPSVINLPGLSNVTITRHIAHERIATTRTEIR